MRSTRPWLLRGLAAFLVLGVFAVAAAPGARAQDDDEDDEPTFEQGLIRSLLGGGAARPDIDYRERSPLVVPPSRDLPPPDAGSMQSNAAWPNDPDKQTRKKSGSGPVIDEWRRAGTPLSRDELRRGARSGAGRHEGPAVTLGDAQAGRPLLPSEYGDGRSLFGMIGRSVQGEPPATFQKEPERTRLTQPPSGYQTPSSGQPYQAPKGTGILSNIPNAFSRGISNDQ